MREWRLGELSLDDAVRAKHRQNARHERTEDFRQWVFDALTDELYIPNDWRYEARSEIASFAAAVAKGRDAFEARREAGFDDGWTIGHYVVEELPDDLCRRIKTKREKLVSDTDLLDATIPVEEGETYDVDIVDIGSEGDGIARVRRYVLIVPDADIGETVTVRVDTVTDSVGFTSVVN